MLTKVRIDKWLWGVRIFKSRTLAADACKAGHVKMGGTTLKPAFLLQGGEVLTVRKNGFLLQFKVVQLIDRRVAAALAEPCYENQTSPDELNKYKDWYRGKANAEVRDRGAGRPTKKERRELDDFKSWDEWDDDDETSNT